MYKTKIPSNIGFWVEEGLSIKAEFVGKIDTLDKKLVEKRFLGIKMLGKEA